MGRIKKRYIILAVVALLVAGGLTWLRSYVFKGVGVSLQERIQSLNISGFNVRYDSLRIDWIGNAIEIDKLILEKNAYDTTCIYPEFISVAKVRAEGLGLFQLIFRNTLSLDVLHLDSARLVLRQNSLLKLDSAAQRKNEFTLTVQDVRLRWADMTYTDSAACQTLSRIRTHVALSRLHLDAHVGAPFLYIAETVTIDSADVELPSDFYRFRVRQAAWNGAKKAFRVDSIKVIPTLGKTEFGRRHGFEIDRFECDIPYLAASGVSASLPDSLHLKIVLAEIQFQLKVFRDKRLPFLKKYKPLPLVNLRALPFQLAIDSLRVLNSFVQYEEFAEATSEPAGIYFDNLRATLANISNTATSGETTLRSKARLYGQGELTLFVTVPLEKGRRSSLAGAIRNFDLPKLNPILTPSTQLEVASGSMKELLFSFQFDDNRSDGEMELNYENLKLVTFKSEEKSNGAGPTKDNLKTFIMNAFIFRKNMTEDLPEDKRKGTISFVRDDTRSIFNFWSKSLVSGIKSAYKLDKVEARKSDREVKKEERQLKREARRQRRSEKKRERG